MEKLLRKYVNGTCNPNEFEEVVSLLSSESGSNKISPFLMSFWNETLNARPSDVPSNSHLLEKIRFRIAMEESKVNAKRVNLFRNLLRFAAAIIAGLLITSGIVFYNIKKQFDSEKSIIENVSVPYGAKTSLVLPDGTEVWLNSGSTISYPKRYGDTRNVDLAGQAYFHVVKNSKPFIVKTKYGGVEVTGTSFDVKAYDDDSFETTLVEGSVKVKNINNKFINLDPGQQAILTDDNKFLLKNVNTELFTSWKDGKLIFVNEPFEKVAKQLERWYNVKIELQGERLKKLGYTGTIEMETFGEVLELINTTAPITHKFDKNSRILRIKGK